LQPYSSARDLLWEWLGILMVADGVVVLALPSRNAKKTEHPPLSVSEMLEALDRA